ncbi:MAG: hypothetical protein FWH40_02595 [Coriobacteriia bacterium]|nr:hypothetical protein [Coriobacteriia bacterium]
MTTDSSKMPMISNTHESSEYDKSLEFIRNEISDYREFMQNQNDSFFKLVEIISGIILGIFSILGIVGFTGIKTTANKKAEEVVNNELQSDQYRHRLEKMVEEASIEEINRILGSSSFESSTVETIKKAIGVDDNNDLKLLRETAYRERMIREHKILFTSKIEGDYDNVESVRKIFEYQGFNTPSSVCEIDENNYEDKISETKIVVYQVPTEEFKDEWNNETDEPLYYKLSKKCRFMEVNLVLLSTNPQGIDMDLLRRSPSPYTTTVNFESKLRETLYMLLYFAQ